VSGPWVPISALNHYTYCPRRCALIHVEQTFIENQYTVDGKSLHEQVDEGHASDGSLRRATALHIWSQKWHLSGIADVVEWHGDVPYPVEFKHGRRDRWVNDDIQLCAQALCLEEMLAAKVPAGAVFYGTSRRRREVVFSEDLRHATIRTIQDVRSLFQAGATPAPTSHRERCSGCSMIDVCLPDLYDRPDDPGMSRRGG
jgi:CRISPR-associated exonuclease Cas4